MPQPKVNCYEFIKKRGFRNIDFFGVKGLLRLAAQKEGAKAQICLLRRTNYASLPHKTNYTKGEKLLQQIFFAEFGGFGQGGIAPNAQVSVRNIRKRSKTVQKRLKIFEKI